MCFVPVIHTLLPYNAAVQQQTLSFLRNGRFERQPPAKTAAAAAGN